MSAVHVSTRSSLTGFAGSHLQYSEMQRGWLCDAYDVGGFNYG